MQGRSWRPLLTGKAADWRKSFLAEYFRENAFPGTPTLVAVRTADARRTLDLYGISAAAHEPLWQQLDVVYFMRNSAREIAWHTRTLLAHVNTDRAIVRSRLAATGDAVEVLIYVRDQKDLFARVCGYFDSRNLSILDARIHTTRHGYALDSFLATDHGRTDHRELLAQINKQLADWIEAVTPLPPPVKGRLSRHSRHFPVAPNVTLAAGERGSQYLLSITTTDRIGLLYSITRVLATHDVNVHTAKINTLGERVEDVFLIDGAMVDDERSQAQLERDLLEAISPWSPVFSASAKAWRRTFTARSYSPRMISTVPMLMRSLVVGGIFPLSLRRERASS